VDARDLDRWLSSLRHSGASGPFRDAARDERLSERTLNKVIEQLVELRSRADVRVLGTLSAAGGEG
jgi:hypothetical protein